MTEAFIVDAVRTPQGRHRGALAGVRADDLAALVVAEVVRRAGLATEAIDEVVLGAANQAGEDNRNVARMAVLLAGLPDETAGYTVNRLCASGLTAVASAANSIKAGDADIVVAGGVESMTRAPWVLAKPAKPWAPPGEIADTSLGWRFVNPVFAEADRVCLPGPGPTSARSPWGWARPRRRWRPWTGSAGRTAMRSPSAATSGPWPPSTPVASRPRSWRCPPATRLVTVDEGPRRTTLERLAGLRPVFRPDGIVTAGSSSPLSDGAAALVLASAEAVDRHGLTPRARVVSSASAGVAPNVMGLGPVPATEKVLDRSGWKLDDIDAIELNEAFAAQSLAVIRRLGLDTDRVNADGGAIALGHPLGCSGARLVVTLLGRLEREGGHKGLATLCVGVGQGVSLLVERL